MTFFLNSHLGLSRLLRSNENRGWIFEAATSNFCNHSWNFSSSPRNGKVDLCKTNGSKVRGLKSRSHYFNIAVYLMSDVFRPKCSSEGRRNLPNCGLTSILQFHKVRTPTYILLKPCQNKKGWKFTSAAPKIVSCSQQSAVRKNTIFDAADANLVPFLFCDCFMNYRSSLAKIRSNVHVM